MKRRSLCFPPFFEEFSKNDSKSNEFLRSDSRYNFDLNCLNRRSDLNKMYEAADTSLKLLHIEGHSFPVYLLDQNRNDGASIDVLSILKFARRNNFANNKHDSLHCASYSVTTLAQFLGLFPVLGINGRSARDLSFRWLSKPMLLSLFILGCCTLINVFTVLHIVNTGFTYYNTVNFVFLASLTCIYLLFIQLARKWPTFVDQWEQVETSDSIFGYSKNLSKKIKKIAILIMLLAIAEHVSAIITKVVDALPCVRPNSDVVQAYFLNTYRHIFDFMYYNVVIASGVVIATVIMSGAWNFIDVFIIIMSIAMTERYKEFNRLLKSVNGKIMPRSFWHHMREEFNKLSHLTKMLDELLSPIVLLSFANNLYFICLQLFNSLKPMASTWHATYFVYSFSYLVFRTIAVSLYAAAIYDESKLPKSVLFSVPSESYCVEVARLITQVTSDDLALTGCRFFSITRTLILTVAGTIVTYEIVLVQFNAVNTDSRENTTIECFN